MHLATGSNRITVLDRPIARQVVLAVTLVVLAIGASLLPLNWLVVATILTGLTLFLLRSPWLVWLLFALLLPFASAERVGPASAADLLLLGALLATLIDGFRRRSVRLSFGLIPALLLIFLGANYVSLLRAPDLAEAAKELLKWVQVAAVLVLVPAILTRDRLKWLVAALLLGGVAQSLLGLYQFAYQIGPDWFIVLGRFMRASGSFAQPNPFAGYLGLTLPVALSLVLWGVNYYLFKHHRQLSTFAWTLFYAVATAVLALGILASWSRGAWLGAAIAVAIVVFMRSRKTALLGVIGLVLTGGTLLLGSITPTLLPAAIRSRLLDLPLYFGMTDIINTPVTDENFAVVERVAHWIAALRMWDLAPWFGVGPGNYEIIYHVVHLPRWNEPLGHAHNVYLNFLAETGIVGLFSYTILLVALCAWLIQGFRHAPVYAAPSEVQPLATLAWDRAVLLGIIGTIAHLSVHNFFDNLFVQGNYLHLSLWLAIAHAVLRPIDAKLDTMSCQESDSASCC
jgi:putative inorganic carbon (hco3(-)) transporter